MKRLIAIMITALVTIALAAPAAMADESLWMKLKGKAQKVAPKKSASATTAVGGVRGAPEDEGKSGLYWKGKEEPVSIDQEELDAFNDALDTAINGDNVASAEKFKAFLAKYPESVLKADAEEALANLQQAANKAGQK